MKGALLIVALAACSKPTPAPAPAAAPATEASRSRVVDEKFHSDALGVDKHVVVYLPAGYDSAPAKHWPVFYYLHGLGGDEGNWTAMGHLDQAADALHLGAIVVMPDGDNGFYADSQEPVDYDACIATGKGLFIPFVKREDTCVRAMHYSTYIAHDLVHWVDATYRTIAARDGRAIAGLSMGGFGAFELGLRFPDEFAAAASHSGVLVLLYGGPYPYVAGHPEQVTPLADVTTWGDKVPQIGAWVRGIFGADRKTWEAYDPMVLVQSVPKDKLPALYIDCGTEDDFGLNGAATYIHDLLTARGVQHEYFEGPGGHDFAFWGPRLPHSLAFLRDHTTPAR